MICAAWGSTFIIPKCGGRCEIGSQFMAFVVRACVVRDDLEPKKKRRHECRRSRPEARSTVTTPVVPCLSSTLGGGRGKFSGADDATASLVLVAGTERAGRVASDGRRWRGPRADAWVMVGCALRLQGFTHAHGTVVG